MKAYKGFDKDMRCLGYQFAVGETFSHDKKIALCESGFHFCKDLVLCFDYYPKETSIFCEVDILGDVLFEEPTKHKGVTNKIKIISIVDVDEMIDKKNNSGDGNSGNGNSGGRNSGNGNSGGRNSGNGNSGDGNSGNGNSGDGNSGNGNSGNWNSGDWNSGGRNSGNWNSGNGNSGNGNSGNWNSGNGNSGGRNSGGRNSGNWNSGNWNSCSNESGYFNTKEAKKIRVFNKFVSRSEWNSADKPEFIYFDILNGKTYKESFIESFKKASLYDISKLKALPGFDAEVFFEISGIRIEVEE